MKFLAIIICSLSIALVECKIYAQSAVLPSNSQLSRGNAAPRMSGQSAAGDNPINIGPLSIGAGAYYRYVSGGRLRGSVGQLGDGSVQEVGLSFNGDLGETGTLYYSPRWSFYSDETLGNRFSHQFGADLGKDGSLHIGDWTVELSPEYSNKHEVLNETAELTQTETWGMDVIARYQINSSVSTGIGTGYRNRDSERYNSSVNKNYQAFITRLFGSGVSTSLIFSGGSENTDPNFNADYTQLSGSVGFQPSEITYFSALVGRQSRSFNVTGAPDLDSTIYSLGFNYTPIEFTSLSIRASSSVGSSLFSNQTRDNETVGIYLNQRLLGSVNLSLGYGQTKAKYLSALNANNEARSDNYDYVDARLSTSILKNVSASIFYRDQKNDSDSSQFRYDGDQHGVEIGYSF